MLETGGGFRFATETLQVRFRGPLAQADHFECDGAVETFLSRAVNYALTSPADFLQQFVITKVSKHLRVIAARVLSAGLGYRPLGRRAVDARLQHFVREQTKTGLEQASRANSLPRVSRNFRPAFSANGGGSLHLMDWPSAPSIR